jgi:hypothetical protein
VTRMAVPFPTNSLTDLFAVYPAPWRVGRRHQMPITGGESIEIRDHADRHVLECPGPLALGIVAAINATFLCGNERRDTVAPPSDVDLFLAEYPAPWSLDVHIPGPPGNAEVSIKDAEGEEIECSDDLAYAAAIVEAMNRAALYRGPIEEAAQ